MNLAMKQKQTHRHREVGEWKVETIGCKMGSRIYCVTRGIKPIFCNNCKCNLSEVYKNNKYRNPRISIDRSSTQNQHENIGVK